MKKTINCIFACTTGVVALVLSFIVYLDYVYLLGFPDGFISELGQAERKLAYIYILGSIVLSIYSIYLGWVALKKEISKNLFVIMFIYLIFILSLYFTDYYYRLHLADSTGG